MLENRITALEDKVFYIDQMKNKISTLELRLDKLESWRRDEEWKDAVNKSKNEMDELKELRDIIAKHFKKDEGKPNPNQKIKINKQVWEDIKREVAEATGYCQCTIKGHHTFGELHRLIKKAEPGWNDKR